MDWIRKNNVLIGFLKRILIGHFDFDFHHPILMLLLNVVFIIIIIKGPDFKIDYLEYSFIKNVNDYSLNIIIKY